MSHLVITLLRIRCDEVTDDFLEGLEDEFDWRLTVFEVNGGTTRREEIPMPSMEKIEAGSEHTINRELARLGPECQEAWLEFWDRDTFSSDDLLGRLEVGAMAQADSPSPPASTRRTSGAVLTGCSANRDATSSGSSSRVM